MPAQAIFHFERLPGIESGLVGSEAVSPVFRAHTFHPLIADLLLQSPAPEVQPNLADKDAKLVDIRYPDQHRSRVGHVAESLFAFPHGALTFLSLFNQYCHEIEGRRA